MVEKVDFSKMTVASAIRYCKEFRLDFIHWTYLKGEDGDLRYTELIEGLENGTIKPVDLPNHGVMNDYY